MQDDCQKQRQLEFYKSANFDGPHLRSPGEERTENELPESIRGKKKYKDVAAAAQEAFESAAYAAAAARAAVALSRSESRDKDPYDDSGSAH